MNLRIGSTSETSERFGIDFITIEFQSRYDKNSRLFNIASLSYNIPFGIVNVGHERCLGLTHNRYSGLHL